MKLRKKYPVIISALIFAALTGLVFLSAALENKYFANEVKNANEPLSLIEQYNSEEADIVYYDGKRYALNKNISTLLIMGIDDFGEAKASNSYNNTAQADFVMLVLLDSANKRYTLLHLNRDTMADITILGINGKEAGTAFEQLALAHTYGSGLADSCQNTISAVSNLLYGINIDHYLSMTMNAVAKINDLIGGVTLTVSDDFGTTQAIKAGETVTLTGELALTYVRNRKDVSDSSNLSRMERQRQYINAFISQFQKKYLEDNTMALDAYSAMEEYLISDLDIRGFSQAVNNLSEYEYNGICSPEGRLEVGAEYMEFYVNNTALQKLIIDLFYQPNE